MVDPTPPKEPGSIASSTFQGFAYLTSSTLATAILRIVVVGLMARLLAPEDFGVVAIANIFVELGRMITTTGIAQALVQRQFLSDGEITTAFTSSLCVGVLSAAGMIAVAPFVARFFELPQLYMVLCVCASIPPAVAASTISSKLLERAHNFKPIAKTSVISYVVAQIVVGVPIGLLGGGYWALVVPQVVASFLQSILLFKVQPHKISLYFGRSEYKELMKLGTGFGFQRFANFIAQRGDYFVVGKLLGPLALGRYERSYVLMNLSNSLLASMMSTVLFPAFSRLSGDLDRFGRAYRRCIALAAIISLPASVVCIVLAREVVETLLGSRWSDATTPFAILAGGIFARTCYKIAGSAGNGLGLAYENAASQTIYAAFVVFGAVIGSRWGVNGVACSTLVAIFVVFLSLNRTVMKHVGLTIAELLNAVKPGLWSALVLGGAAYGAIFLIRLEMPMAALFRLLLALSVAGSAYVVCLLACPILFLGQEMLEFLDERIEMTNKVRPIFRWLNRSRR